MTVEVAVVGFNFTAAEVATATGRKAGYKLTLTSVDFPLQAVKPITAEPIKKILNKIKDAKLVTDSNN